MGFFSSVCPRSSFFFKFASFLSIQRGFEPFQCPRNILFINFRDEDVLESNQYRLCTSRGCQQSNCFVFSPQLGDFDYFMAEKHPNMRNLVYDYKIKKMDYFEVLCHGQISQCTAVFPLRFLSLGQFYQNRQNWRGSRTKIISFG